MNYTEVKNKFHSLFKTNPVLFRSPGRINLIGEHTDYNNGFVIPAAIDKEIYAAISLNEDYTINIFSLDYNEKYSHTIGETLNRTNSWPDYILGVVYEIIKSGYFIKGFNCVLSGNVPVGAGLSSSAAVECTIAFAINELNNLQLDKMNLVKIAQNAENNFVGVNCGIMDQFASVYGLNNMAILLDCKSLTHKYFPLELDGYELILIDTKVKHSLASSEYNKRRTECEEGVIELQKIDSSINSLRDANKSLLEKVKNKLSDNVYNRCKYVIEEIARTQAAAIDLEKGKIIEFGRKMNETHHGLSTLYEVSCKELDFLVEIAEKEEGVIGSRMMGGGFGGCTINILHKNAVYSFKKIVTEKYKKAFGIKPEFIEVKTADGTSKIR